MPAYSVFLPERALRARDLAESPVFVADGFSWMAFYFTPIWCIWRRSWFGLIVWTSIAAAFFIAAFWLQIPLVGMLTMMSLLSFAFALEAGVLVRRSLSRRGMRLVDWVVAPDIEQAERQFFERWNQVRSNSASPYLSTSASVGAFNGIGLFPDGGRAT